MFNIIDCNIDCHVRWHERGCDGFVFVQYNAYSVRKNLWPVFGTQSYNTIGRLITHLHYLNREFSNSHCPVCGLWHVLASQFTRVHTKKFIRIVIFVFKTHVAAFHSKYMDVIFIHDFGAYLSMIDWDIESITVLEGEFLELIFGVPNYQSANCQTAVYYVPLIMDSIRQ